MRGYADVQIFWRCLRPGLSAHTRTGISRRLVSASLPHREASNRRHAISITMFAIRSFAIAQDDKLKRSDG